jgi:HD-like signal output (HDOD) protein
MDEAEKNGLIVYEAEKNYFNTTHASVGAWMAQKWRFPRNLIDVIEYHHKPHLAKTAPVDSAIIHLADILVRARGFGFAGDRFLVPVNPEAWDRLALTETHIKEILLEAEDSFQMTEDLSL